MLMFLKNMQTETSFPQDIADNNLTLLVLAVRNLTIV